MAFISNLYLAFQRIAKDNENRIALRYPSTGAETTYRELGLLVDHIAEALWAKGLRQGQVAAFFHDKSPAAFAAMLACLRLGIIYTNLDPASPWERVRKILANCKPASIVNAFEVLPFAHELASAGYGHILHLRGLPQTIKPISLPGSDTISGGSPAYIMFTSGSTGTPKGAVMSHANVLWFTQWAQDRFGITTADVLTNVNPIYFDNSVFDFYCAILSGATLVPFTPDQVKNARLLMEQIGWARCTVWFSVPSLIVYLLTTRVFASAHLSHIRLIAFGGEGFPKPKLKQLYDTVGDHVILENVYGPTECTCICSAHRISAPDFEDMLNLATLGKLAQNFDYEILPQDEADSEFGELFLRGPQVGLGYFNDPEKTNNVFIQNPNHDSYADIGYRTGDLVRRDAYGNLHFKGRTDFQIKHLGYRIELQEVEAAISTLLTVEETAVIYQRFENGLGQLVAYVAGSSLPTSQDLLVHVASVLPPYMVPRRIVVLAELPKNANGKIDRKQLEDRASEG